MIRNETGLLDDYGNDLNGYVWGETTDGKRALVVLTQERAAEQETACYVATVDGLRLCGLRWECSAAHLDSYAELYRNRFPKEG